MTSFGPKCVRHVNNSTSLRCNDCEVSLCVECMETDHFNHSFKSYRAHMQERAEMMLGKIPDLNQHAIVIETELNDSQQIINDLKRKLSEHEKKNSELNTQRKKLRELTELEPSLKSLANGFPVINDCLHSTLNDERWFKFMKTNKEPVACRETGIVRRSHAQKKQFVFEETFDGISSLKKMSWESNLHSYRDHDLYVQLQYKTIDGTAWLGLFLGVSPIEKIDDKWELQLNFSVHLINKSGKRSFDIRGPAVFNERRSQLGSTKFMKWNCLLNPRSGWHSNERIRIRVEILEQAD